MKGTPGVRRASAIEKWRRAHDSGRVAAAGGAVGAGDLVRCHRNHIVSITITPKFSDYQILDLLV